MSERDELVQIIMSPESFDSGPPSCGPNDLYAARTADAILAAGYRKPRVVTTVDELNVLTTESVVRSDAGLIYEKYADEDGREFDYWLLPGEQRAQAAIKVDLPAIILHEGDQS